MIFKTCIERGIIENSSFKYLQLIGLFGKDDIDSIYHPDAVFSLTIETQSYSKILSIQTCLFVDRISAQGITIIPMSEKRYFDEFFIPMSQVVTMYIRKYDRSEYEPIPKNINEPIKISKKNKH